jgi:hypothetical protein
MREGMLPAVVEYSLITEPDAFQALIAAWRTEPRLWIDTEIADWFTANPRLSLLQVRDGFGRICVVDVLHDPMRQVVTEAFIPEVMANPSVQKWAHYARYEQRFLGQEQAVNLQCTFKLARAIPYYRLPLRSLRLDALVEHFFGQAINKALQKADWGIRPLSSEHLQYAAADAHWCYQVHDGLQRIPGPSEASVDNPESIEARYVQILRPLRDARSRRAAIRDSVKELMLGRHLARFSRFILQTRTTHSTSLAELVRFAVSRDPGQYFDLAIALSARIRSLLGSCAETTIRSVADIGVSQAFRGPRGPRDYVESPPYIFNELEVERVTHDYEAIEHEVLLLESERAELRERMKGWMMLRGLAAWGDFRFSAPKERWTVDARALSALIPHGTDAQIAFPKRLQLAFQDEELESLVAAGESRQTPVLRWLSRALSVGPQAQESRDWESDDDDGTESTAL